MTSSPTHPTLRTFFCPSPPTPPLYFSFLSPPTPPLFFFLLPCRRFPKIPEPLPTLSEGPSQLRKIGSEGADDVRLVSLFRAIFRYDVIVLPRTIFNNQSEASIFRTTFRRFSEDLPKILSTNQKPGDR